MFWIGQALVVVAGLLRIGFVRSILRRRIPQASERTFDVILVALLAVGVGTAVWEYRDQLRTINSLETDIGIVRDYSDMALLNFNGSQFVGGDIAFNSPLTHLMEGTFTEVSPGRFRRVCTDDARRKYRQAIHGFPRFPFSHYWLALCLHDSGDHDWTTHAQTARSIFERTTRIAGHQQSHDQALAQLDKLLN